MLDLGIQGKSFNIQFHERIFLAEIFYLVRQLGNLDAELHGKEHQEDYGTEEKCGSRESGPDEGSQGNKPFVAKHQNEHDRTGGKPEDGIFLFQPPFPYHIYDNYKDKR